MYGDDDEDDKSWLNEVDDLHEDKFGGDDKANAPIEDEVFEEDDEGEPHAAAAEDDDEYEVSYEDDEPAEEQIIEDNGQYHGLSVKVKNRIMRSERLRRQSEQTANELRRALEETQKAAQEFQANSYEAQSIAASVAIDRLDDNMKRLQRSIITAKEEGDVEAEFNAQQELSDVKNRRDSIAHAAQSRPELTPYQSQMLLQHQQRQQSQGQTAPPKNAPLADQWKTQNPWFTQPENKIERQAFLTLSDAMDKAQEFDPNTPEYYAELNKRFARKFPGFTNLKSVGGKPHIVRRRAPARSPIAPAVSRRAVSAPASKGRSGPARLTQADLTNMEMFGLDPTDSRVRERWRLEKKMSQ
jgi:hypothetical protein